MFCMPATIESLSSGFYAAFAPYISSVPEVSQCQIDGIRQRRERYRQICSRIGDYLLVVRFAGIF